MKKMMFWLVITVSTMSATAKEYCEVFTKRLTGTRRSYEIRYGNDDPRNEEGKVNYIVDIINMMEKKEFEYIDLHTVFDGKILLFVRKN